MTDRKDWNLRRGEQHWKWVGQDASYQTMHDRINAWRGLASGYSCVDCGQQALHWSYDHLDSGERTSEEGLSYSLDVDHYEPRCVPCHKLKDCAQLMQERGGSLSAAPRCGKPIRSARILAHLEEGAMPPVCGRPAGHAGRCSTPETYWRTLERNRQRNRAIARSGEWSVAPPKPRCGQPIRVRRGAEPDTCGRPEGHAGQHSGTRAYRQQLDRTQKAETLLRGERRSHVAEGAA